MLLTCSSKSQIFQHFDFQLKWRFRARRNLENALYWDISFSETSKNVHADAASVPVASKPHEPLSESVHVRLASWSGRVPYRRAHKGQCAPRVSPL